MEFRGTKIEFAFSVDELKEMFEEATKNQKIIADECPTIWEFVKQASNHFV